MFLCERLTLLASRPDEGAVPDAALFLARLGRDRDFRLGPRAAFKVNG